MNYLSTTSMAKEMEIPVQELFEQLRKIDWIERKYDKWILTDVGKLNGGKIQNSEKFGEYIVWPETNIDSIFSTKNVYQKSKYLNSTTLGQHFSISNQRLNLILSEIGWVEKDIAGWKITKQGYNNSGRQFETDSGQFYVKWPENIVDNKILLEAIIPESNILTNSKPNTKEIATPLTKENKQHEGFREKYPPTHKALDGHFVRSRAEQLIDNFLYTSGIVHAYERKLPIDGEDFYCDFFIPSGHGRPQGVYIEFWGMENDPKYLEKKKKKIEAYKINEFPLIELRDIDIENLEESLTRYLLKHKIKIGN
ncbi:MAG: glycerol kinase [Chitinophaga sp.]|nr:glycerol kinase [Chitinophaga sp.]